MSKKVKHVLNVSARSGRGSGLARRLRRDGLIPAVVYGKGADAKQVSLKSSEWESLSKFEVKLVSLLIEGGDETRALVKEVQRDFVKGNAIHIDFQEVRKDEIITASVTVYAGHTPPVGLSMGGILEQPLHELEVSCLPDALPEHIEIDISKLEIGQAIHVRDVVLPEGVKAVSLPELVVFHVVEQALAEESEAAAEGAEAVAEGVAAAEPELVGAKEKAEKAAAEAAAEEESKKKK